MAGGTVVKGRIEEAVGVLVGNDKLRGKGRTDQAAGQARRVAEKGGGHRLWKTSPSDADEEMTAELGVEDDAEVRRQTLEMLERIRVAAGQTC